MNSVITFLYKKVFKTTEFLFPALAGKWAARLFTTPIRHKRPEREQLAMESARIEQVKLTPQYSKPRQEPFYQTYAWGDGPLVLLVHGWAGRGSQMGTLAPSFVEAGYKVITFDAFAHGESPGKTSNLVEFKQIIQHIYKNHGAFHAIVGHSLGGIAAGLAIAEGVEAGKLVTMGSPTTMDFITKSFCLNLGANKKTAKYILDNVKNLTQKEADYFSLASIGKQLNIYGLIIHDEDDKESDYSQALLLDKSWKNSRLFSTKKLGHRRILRDEKVQKTILDFIESTPDVQRVAS